MDLALAVDAHGGAVRGRTTCERVEREVRPTSKRPKSPSLHRRARRARWGRPGCRRRSPARGLSEPSPSGTARRKVRASSAAGAAPARGAAGARSSGVSSTTMRPSARATWSVPGPRFSDVVARVEAGVQPLEPDVGVGIERGVHRVRGGDQQAPDRGRRAAARAGLRRGRHRPRAGGTERPRILRGERLPRGQGELRVDAVGGELGEAVAALPSNELHAALLRRDAGPAEGHGGLAGGDRDLPLGAREARDPRRSPTLSGWSRCPARPRGCRRAPWRRRPRAPGGRRLPPRRGGASAMPRPGGAPPRAAPRPRRPRRGA